MIDQVIIVGAGFSYNAGLPLQAGFTAGLLTAAGFKKGPSKRLVEYLCDFVRDTAPPAPRELDPLTAGRTSKTSSPASTLQ